MATIEIYPALSLALYIAVAAVCTLLRWSKRRCAEGPTLCEGAVRHFCRVAQTFLSLDRPSKKEALQHRSGYAVAVVKAKV